MTTLPELRPHAFIARHSRGMVWLEPGDDDYEWVLDDLREHEAIGAVLERITPHSVYGEQPADVVMPQIVYGRRHRIELRWCSAVAVFDFVRRDHTYALNEKRSDIDPFDIRPDGRIMVTT